MINARRSRVLYRFPLVALVLMGLALTAPAVATAAVPAGHTISSAKPLKLSQKEAGGGGKIDFWTVHLIGGDQMQLVTTQQTDEPGTAINTNYSYELYKPGTTDGSFQSAIPLGSQDTEGTANSVLMLQAPYTGTFVLAVCENAQGNCGVAASGDSFSPMQAYHFTAKLIGGGVSAKVGAKETRAAAAIAKAPVMPVGNFESGGGNAIDIWKVRLNGADQVRFITSQQADEPGTAINTNYFYELYKPGTTDQSLPGATPVQSASTQGTVSTTLVLRAPSTGTFVLAVCENVQANCGAASAGGGLQPMTPYTFTTTLIGGHETQTALRLSPPSVTFGHEKSLALSVTVAPRFSGRPTGTVIISAGKTRVCTLTLSHGKAKCTPRSSTQLRPGKYTLVAAYQGTRNFAASKSAGRLLMVRKPT